MISRLIFLSFPKFELLVYLSFVFRLLIVRLKWNTYFTLKTVRVSLRSSFCRGYVISVPPQAESWHIVNDEW
jgi:hypothetical protein